MRAYHQSIPTTKGDASKKRRPFGCLRNYDKHHLPRTPTRTVNQILIQQGGSWQQSEDHDRHRRTETATASAGDPSSRQRTGTDNSTTPKSEAVIVTPKREPTTPSGTSAGRHDGYRYATPKEILPTGKLVGADQGAKTIKYWCPVPTYWVRATDTGKTHQMKPRKPCSPWHAPSTIPVSSGKNKGKSVALEGATATRTLGNSPSPKQNMTLSSRCSTRARPILRWGPANQGGQTPGATSTPARPSTTATPQTATPTVKSYNSYELHRRQGNPRTGQQRQRKTLPKVDGAQRPRRGRGSVRKLTAEPCAMKINERQSAKYQPHVRKGGPFGPPD